MTTKTEYDIDRKVENVPCSGSRRCLTSIMFARTTAFNCFQIRHTPMTALLYIYVGYTWRHWSHNMNRRFITTSQAATTVAPGAMSSSNCSFFPRSHFFLFLSLSLSLSLSRYPENLFTCFLARFDIRETRRSLDKTQIRVGKRSVCKIVTTRRGKASAENCDRT